MYEFGQVSQKWASLLKGLGWLEQCVTICVSHFGRDDGLRLCGVWFHPTARI